MAKVGRKSYAEEFNIVKHYEEISPYFFKFLLEKMKEGTSEEKWKACQIVEGGMKKFIPNILQGDKDNPLIGIIQYPIINGNNNEQKKSNIS